MVPNTWSSSWTGEASSRQTQLSGLGRLQWCGREALRGSKLGSWAVMAMALWALVVMVDVPLPVEGTHFRYGTLYWHHTRGMCVAFVMKTAFRRNYNWGQYFREEYRIDSGPWIHGGSFIGTKENRKAFENFTKEPEEVYIKRYKLRFGVGMRQEGYPMTPKGICSSPFHKGWNRTFPMHPWGELDPPGANFDKYVCAPWSETFGFFFGDDTPGSAVEVDITNIDTSLSLVGNVLRGTSKPIEHCYNRPVAPDGQPWLAFFTGGDRIDNLNNNANGRYRLEIEVSLNITNGVINTSPIATQIPVLPVPYTDSPSHARFQIAAYDPDVGDVTHFRLGDSFEHGALMAHKMVDGKLFRKGVKSWHQDVYENYACNKLRSAYGQQIGPRWCPNFNETSWLVDESIMPWNNATFYPGPPPDLDIDRYTGFVTFRTGKDPWTASTPEPLGAAPAQQQSYKPKLPGFYNLVVMVLDVSHGGLKVPIDFLLYLYPSMHYCSIDCNNTKPGVARLSTFESFNGLYGDPRQDDAEHLVYDSPGTGFCALCGGGGQVVNSSGQVLTQFTSAPEVLNIRYHPINLENGTMYCHLQEKVTGQPLETGDPGHMRGKKAAGYTCDGGIPCSEAVTSTAVEIGEGTCMGTREYINGEESVKPYGGSLTVCRLNTKPYFLTKDTEPPGPTPAMGPVVVGPNNLTGIREPAVVRQKVGENVTFTLRATDDDECVELEIGETGLYPGMSLSDHERLDPWTVQRNFTWAVQLGPLGNDIRDRDVLVCFYAFDKYLITADPFHCVRILLTEPSNVIWCEDSIPYGDTPATFEAYYREESCIPLCVRRDAVAYQASLAIRTISDSAAVQYPFPHDKVNYPSTGQLLDFRGTHNVTARYCFTPTEGFECTYTVCFQGFDMNPGSNDATSIRCFRIEVLNDVLQVEFTPPYNGASAVAPTLSNSILPNRGLTFSAWILPGCDRRGVNETVLHFGSAKTGNSSVGNVRVRNAIVWNMGTQGGRFLYFDGHIGDVFSPPYYSCNLWHYVVVSIAPNNSGILVVDNTKRGHRLNNRRDVYKFSITPFETPSRPDNGIDGDDDGYFNIGYFPGQPFLGSVDEVRVWNRPLTLDEIREKMFLRQLDPSTERNLVGYYTMRPSPPILVPWYSLMRYRYMQTPNHTMREGFHDFSGHNHTLIPTHPRQGIMAAYGAQAAIPSMIPCVMGLEHPVGPCHGDCPMDVYGWSIAASQMLKCRFGDVEVEGVYEDDRTVRCSSPGYFSPRYVDVTLSNDGYRFTNPDDIGKRTQHLYLESTLYLDGTKNAGASADGVCQDLPSSAVTFGGWFCPRCGPTR